MISRRRFLEAGGITAGAVAISNSLAKPALAKGGNSIPLPPSIERLKSRKREATPITREEREARQERASKLMADHGMDEIVMMEGTSLRYFSGIHWWGGERMFAFILPAKGRKTRARTSVWRKAWQKKA